MWPVTKGARVRHAEGRGLQRDGCIDRQVVENVTGVEKKGERYMEEAVECLSAPTSTGPRLRRGRARGAQPQRHTAQRVEASHRRFAPKA